jgi:hypothetical protein
MRQPIKLMFLLIYFFPNQATAQTTSSRGSIVTIANENAEGVVKLSPGEKGKLIFLSSENKRKVYTPSGIKSFSIDSINYISYRDDFYEEVSAGLKAKLYKKITDHSGEKIYNGAEVVGFVETTEGKRGDFYLLPATMTQLDLITKKNFRDYFSKLFNTNDSLLSQVKNGNLEYSQIKKAVELYNE